MNLAAAAATAVLTMGLLSACAGPLLAPEDREHVCRVAVDIKFDSPVFHPNPHSNAAGSLSGMAVGAAMGVNPSVLTLLTVPLGAAVGAAYGTACALANESHPTANAEFERILEAVDARSLARALEADLNVPRAGCARSEPNASAGSEPDTLIEIEQLDVTMGCAFGIQEYGLTMKWRVLTAIGKREVTETTTYCLQRSTHDVDSWLADPARARDELERVLDRAGRWMAKRVFASGPVYECRFQSSESGAIEDR